MRWGGGCLIWLRDSVPGAFSGILLGRSLTMGSRWVWKYCPFLELGETEPHKNWVRQPGTGMNPDTRPPWPSSDLRRRGRKLAGRKAQSPRGARRGAGTPRAGPGHVITEARPPHPDVGREVRLPPGPARAATGPVSPGALCHSLGKESRALSSRRPLRGTGEPWLRARPPPPRRRLPGERPRFWSRVLPAPAASLMRGQRTPPEFLSASEATW